MRFINLSVISIHLWNNAASKPHNFASKKSQLDTVTCSNRSTRKKYKKVFLMKKEKKIIMIGNTCLFQSSVQASELFVYTISVLNSFLFFLFFLCVPFPCHIALPLSIRVWWADIFQERQEIGKHQILPRWLFAVSSRACM